MSGLRLLTSLPGKWFWHGPSAKVVVDPYQAVQSVNENALLTTFDEQMRLLQEMLKAAHCAQATGLLNGEQERMLNFLTALVCRLQSGNRSSMISAVGSQLAFSFPGVVQYGRLQRQTAALETSTVVEEHAALQTV